MNIVSLIGRLTADPELKHTQSGTAMTRFTLAVDRAYTKPGEEKQADFITIVAWQQKAEFVCKYFSKGRRMALTGSIRTGSYTAQDGSKRYTTEVFADNIEFCDSKKDFSPSDSGYGEGNSYNSYSNNRQSSYRSEPAPAPSYSSGNVEDYSGTLTDDDLPF